MNTENEPIEVEPIGGYRTPPNGTAAINWVEPETGCISVTCTCGKRLILREKAIKERAVIALAEFEESFHQARQRIIKAGNKRRRIHKAEGKAATELAALKRQLRKLAGVKLWGHE